MADPAVPVDRTPLDLDALLPCSSWAGDCGTCRNCTARLAILAEVERLRAELADHHCDCLAGKLAEVRVDRDRLAAQVERVEAVRAEWEGIGVHQGAFGALLELRAALAVPVVEEGEAHGD